jgi:hypothetical protein
MIDAETQWIESFYTAEAYTDRLLPGATDPASFSELIGAGYDSWDFGTVSDLYARPIFAVMTG